MLRRQELKRQELMRQQELRQQQLRQQQLRQHQLMLQQLRQREMRKQDLKQQDSRLREVMQQELTRMEKEDKLYLQRKLSILQGRQQPGQLSPRSSVKMFLSCTSVPVTKQPEPIIFCSELFDKMTVKDAGHGAKEFKGEDMDTNQMTSSIVNESEHSEVRRTMS